MIFYETLRLYPIGAALLKKTVKQVKLGNLDVPKETEFYLATTVVHHDKKIWGEDADSFNPLRFRQSKKHLGSYFPFGLGNKTCPGQSLAMVETKVALAMIIRQYSFVLSPTYVHAPIVLVSLQPQYGAPLLFRRLP